jgi:CHAT domain-containing protein/tetratricopeptide (TPR) repeat protein
LKTAKVLACCLLVLPFSGIGPGSATTRRATEAQHNKALGDQVKKDLDAAADVFREGRFEEALRRFEAVRELARQARQPDQEVRAAASVGACQFALHQYQSALQSFLKARRMAQLAGYKSVLAALDSNIASLYSQMGQLEPAAQWIEGTAESLGPKDQAELPKILIQLGTVRADQKHLSEALRLFRQAAEAADRARDPGLYAIAWNRIGEELLARGRLAEAEPFLLEAYRVRRLKGLTLDTSYRNLGQLRLEQGDLASASALLDRAVELAERPSGGVLPVWNVYKHRGRARMAQGRLREALADLRIASRLARAWKWTAPQDDAGRVGAESWLEDVDGALIEAGNRLYLETGDPALLAETFEAEEENRAGSLRALAAAARNGAGLPAEYWEAVTRLQRAEVAAIRARDREAEQQAAAARSELMRIEAGIAAPLGARESSGPLLEQARAALGSGAALLSFHLGESASWLWALDRTGLELRRLPARAELEARARDAREAIENDSEAATAAGAALHGALFGALPRRFREKTRWVLELDGDLYQAPFAALAESLAPVRLTVEMRAVEIAPGAAMWLDSARRGGFQAGRFLGVGDPVYNFADPRLGGSRRPSSGAKPLVMPRLAASGPEIDRCARAWGSDAVLLKGREASRERVRQELARGPAVVHFATHVLESAGKRQGLIALSLTDSGETETLGPEEISRWRMGGGLVVLSGCRSSAGAALPGTGLLGLTRAWLAAGANAVLASDWVTADEDGALFAALYRNLKSGERADAASALRAAQLEMIAAGGWRGRPRYWGAFFVLGGAA